MIILELIMFIHLMNVKKHFLSFLIGLEFLTSNILFMMNITNFNYWLFMLMLVYIVCEAVIGLSLLVSLNFMIGNDKIENTSMMC